MHRIYEDEGNYNILYQLPQIAYSFAISFITDLIITSFALSQDNLLDIKNEKKLDNIDRKGQRIKRILILKSIVFFILVFIFIITFWYYLGCFCAVYKNTQYHLIKDTLISYGMSTLTPFGYYLIPALLRILALKENNSGKEKLYELSQFLQKIF